MLILFNPQLGIVLNPTAGKGRAKKIEQQLINYLRLKNISFKLEITKRPGHAVSIAQKLSKEHEIIIAAGGDGTINEVITGIVGTKSALAILPIGSGNDFNKNIGISKKINQAIDAIVDGEKKLFDYGKIKYCNASGKKQNRIFINTSGIGLDAEIAQKTKEIKYLRGLFLYLIATIKAILIHFPNEYKIKEKNKVKSKKAFLVCIGNGGFEGGGFKMLPDARPDDGYLDICVIEAMPFIKAIKYIRCFIKGTHKTLRSVAIWKTKKIKIQTNKPFLLHCDGEIIEEKMTELEIEIITKGIPIIVPKNTIYAL